MTKPLKSQWSFGELFPPEATRRVFSVSELTMTVKRVIEGQVGRVWVSGEISNFRLQSSGHSYFAIKDAGAQLGCVLFRDEARSVERDLLRDGQKVVLCGEMTVYEPRGQYQLRVTKIEIQGVGALQAAFERLKQKLNAEGLFAAEHKRPLPSYPARIGIVTSPTGAALHDVLHVIGRRDSALGVVLAPCRVQGAGAAEEIAAAIRLLNEWNATAIEKLDLILVTRGGGSIEDLWAFNEEVVALAIFESRLPVVSAVGHEIDFTISDFVADVRAATPSAAAEIITEGMFASREFVSDASEHLRELALARIAAEHERLASLTHRLSRLHPRRRLQDRAQRLDDLQASLLRCVKSGCRTQRTSLGALLQRISRLRPSDRINEGRERLGLIERRLGENARRLLVAAHARHTQAAAQLKLLSPENVLGRGYSITTDAVSGNIVRDAHRVAEGQRLKIRLQRGEIAAVAGEGSPK
ncbi:MAG: exodeoxyribonuclease VII large subunit [Pedosphaera sp.]|nr:exodeoxyribonuclease VII large subunit [Pedosphaera sp.]